MTKQTKTSEERSSAAGLFLRVIWMMAGPMSLAIMAGHIAFNNEGDLTAEDGYYLAIVVVMILSRFLDITRFEGTTGDGERATMVHLNRYSIVVIIAAVTLWALAHWVVPTLG